MPDDKKITGLPDASLPIASGVKFEAVQGGINVKVDADDMPGSGAAGVTSVTGTTNRIISSGGATPVIDIDAAYDAAITSQINAAIVGLYDDRGNFDASVNAYPSSGGSGTAGAILKGDIWRISVAGTLPTGLLVQVGDAVRALVDTPGNTQANWAILEGTVPTAATVSFTPVGTIAATDVQAAIQELDSDTVTSRARVAATGTAVSFAVPQIYGTVGTPETGDITLVGTGLVLGMTQVMFHNHTTTQPIFDGNFVRVGGGYVVNTLNTIRMEALSATRIEYTITQES